jgi:hypothetical protein
MAARKRKAPDDEVEDKGVMHPRLFLPHHAGVDAPPPLHRVDCHFRGLYSSEPNFRQLGKQDADFARLYVQFAPPRPISGPLLIQRRRLA